MKICVFGAASNEIDESYIKTTEEFGFLLAKRGHSLVFGAGGHGLMGACARGVKKAGGEITGVIPEFFKDENIELIYDKCDTLIYTETMAQRKSKMEDLADAFVIVPGGIGTFEEFFEVLTLKQLARHNKAIVIFNTGGYYDKMLEALKEAEEKDFIRPQTLELYEVLNDPDEIISYLEKYVPPKIDIVKTKGV